MIRSGHNDPSKYKCCKLFRATLSTRVFETRTATGRDNFASWDSIVSQIFILLISNEEKLLSNVKMVAKGQVKGENSSLPVTVRVSKRRVLKFPIITENTGLLFDVDGVCGYNTKD